MSVDWRRLLTPPEVGAALVPALSVELLAELWTHWGSEIEHPLDAEAVALALLRSGDPAREVVALRFVDAGWASRAVQDTIFETAKKSAAHALALASNRRFSWYGLRNAAERLFNEVLEYEPGGIPDGERWYQPSVWERLMQAAASNPAMDRATIGALIRGQPPFEQPSALVRSMVGVWAVHNVNYEEPEAYPGKDMPTSYEMDFRRPSEALLWLIKEGDFDEEHFAPVVRALQRPAMFSIAPSDWADEIDVAGGDRLDAAHKRRQQAMENFLNWCLNHFENEPLDVDPSSDFKARQFFRGDFAVVAAMCALRDPMTTYDERFLRSLSSSPNWIARSAYYASRITEATTLRPRFARQVISDLARVSHGDELALLRGAMCNEDSTKLMEGGELGDGREDFSKLLWKAYDAPKSQQLNSHVAQLPGATV